MVGRLRNGIVARIPTIEEVDREAADKISKAVNTDPIGKFQQKRFKLGRL